MEKQTERHQLLYLEASTLTDSHETQEKSKKFNATKQKKTWIKVIFGEQEILI